MKLAPLSTATLNEYVARTEHECQLLADLLDAKNRPVNQGQASRWVDGELPYRRFATLLLPYESYRTAGRGTAITQTGTAYSSIGLPRQVGIQATTTF